MSFVWGKIRKNQILPDFWQYLFLFVQLGRRELTCKLEHDVILDHELQSLNIVSYNDDNVKPGHRSAIAYVNDSTFYRIEADTVHNFTDNGLNIDAATPGLSTTPTIVTLASFFVTEIPVITL